MSDSPVLLITGASSGIGEATAKRAAEAGWRIALAARSADKLEALTHEIDGAVAIPTDVTSWEDNEAMVQRTLAEHGRLDAVFANAGFGGARGWLKGEPDEWREMVLTNVLGAAYTVRAALPALTESKGHVLITSSVAGRRAIPGSFYSVTKHAVTAMGEALRQDLDGTGIRVTLIEPGMVDTPFFDNRPTSALQDDDIARAVMYALSQPPHVDVNEILVRPTAQAGERRGPPTPARGPPPPARVPPREPPGSVPLPRSQLWCASRRARYAPATAAPPATTTVPTA